MKLFVYLFILILLIVSVFAESNYHVEDFYLIHDGKEYRPKDQNNPLIVNAGDSLIANLTISNNGNETADDVQVNFGASDLLIGNTQLPEHVINITGLNSGEKASYTFDIKNLNLRSWFYNIGAGVGFSQNELEFGDNSAGSFVTIIDPNIDVGLFPNQFLSLNLVGGLNQGDNLSIKVKLNSFLNDVENASVVIQLYWLADTSGGQKIPVPFMDAERSTIQLLRKDVQDSATINFTELSRNVAFLEVFVFPFDSELSDNYVWLNASARLSGEDVKSMAGKGASCNNDAICDANEDFFRCPVDCVQPQKILSQCIRQRDFYESYEYFTEGYTAQFMSNNQNNIIELLKINNAAKTVDVDFNGKNVVLQKGIAQSLNDGERVLLAELGNVNINNNNVLVALLCSKGATSKVPTVSYDLALITQLINQPLLGELLNISTIIKNHGPNDYVSGASLLFTFFDFDGTKRIVLNDKLSSLAVNNDSEKNYLLDLTGEERYLEIALKDNRDPLTDNNIRLLDVFGKVPKKLNCGDNSCDIYLGENNSNCKQDCLASCGDKTCDAASGETVLNCISDCGCGDGFCSFYEFGETINNCKQDCENAEVCGDNRCIGNETNIACPHDCKKRTAILPSINEGDSCKSTTECRHLGLFSCWDATCQSDIKMFFHVFQGNQKPKLLI